MVSKFAAARKKAAGNRAADKKSKKSFKKQRKPKKETEEEKKAREESERNYRRDVRKRVSEWTYVDSGPGKSEKAPASEVRQRPGETLNQYFRRVEARRKMMLERPRDIGPAAPTSSKRKEHLKQRKEKKKNKKKTLAVADPPEFKKDHVKFGETVERPPVRLATPRLPKSFQKQSSSAPVDGLPKTERPIGDRVANSMRSTLIQAYRDMKKRSREGEGAGVEGSLL